MGDPTAVRYALGIDLGSSSVKVSAIDIDGGRCVASASAPATEMPLSTPRPDWAEQDPAMWWRHLGEALALLGARIDRRRIVSIGVSYQMHGLVAVDREGEPVRPAIIWCDSRAVEVGEAALRELGGAEAVLPRLLNTPGNFTASKVAWVKQHEPACYRRIHKVMLPGDYIAYRLTGEIATTNSGLSEGIMWEFPEHRVAHFLLDHYGIDEALLADAGESFGERGRVNATAAAELGLPVGVPVAYRAGDQPNNAFSLRVLHPGEVAATAGTSGVVYGIVDRPVWDTKGRVNTFLHVNHTAQLARYGVLQVLNGTGILNRWVREMIGDRLTYQELNDLAATAPIGSDGLMILPFGNGAERILAYQPLGGSIEGLHFSVHGRQHIARAAQEGIVFALRYGVEILRSIGIRVEMVRAGHANMFLSPLFRQGFATVVGATVELYNTDGSEGAARGGAVGAGLYGSLEEAFAGVEVREHVEPEEGENATRYAEAYAAWHERVEAALARSRA